VAHDAGARLSQISVREREYFAHPSVQLAALNEVSKLRESRCSHGDEDEFRTYTMVRGQFLAGSATADTRIPPGPRWHHRQRGQPALISAWQRRSLGLSRDSGLLRTTPARKPRTAATPCRKMPARVPLQWATRACC
jgi:hypothetical protein